VHVLCWSHQCMYYAGLVSACIMLVSSVHVLCWSRQCMYYAGLLSAVCWG
jgi:hypothetical protein